MGRRRKESATLSSSMSSFAESFQEDLSKNEDIRTLTADLTKYRSQIKAMRMKKSIIQKNSSHPSGLIRRAPTNQSLANNSGEINILEQARIDFSFALNGVTVESIDDDSLVVRMRPSYKGIQMESYLMQFDRLGDNKWRLQKSNLPFFCAEFDELHDKYLPDRLKSYIRELFLYVDAFTNRRCQFEEFKTKHGNSLYGTPYMTDNFGYLELFVQFENEDSPVRFQLTYNKLDIRPTNVDINPDLNDKEEWIEAMKKDTLCDAFDGGD